MPVAMLVIVPTSRGVSCGVKASRTWLIPANALSKTLWRLSGSVFIGSLFRGLGFFRSWYGSAAWLQVCPSLSEVRRRPFPATQGNPRCSKPLFVHSW